MSTKSWAAPLVAAFFSGCGGGGDVFIGVGGSSEEFAPSFLSWTGNSNRDRVVDANNDDFAFYSDTGCLYNFRTDRENPSFCLTLPSGNVRYGGLSMRVVNALSAAGTCITVLVEESTANFVNIELDTLGNEVVFVTGVRPASCV